MYSWPLHSGEEEQDRRVSMTSMKRDKNEENSTKVEENNTTVSESFVEIQQLSQGKRKNETAFSSRSSATFSMRSFNQTKNIVCTSEEQPLLPPHGTIVHLYSSEDSQLLCAKCINEVWYLDCEESGETGLPATQFILIRTNGFVGFRSCIANGCLLQCNNKHELRFTNPKFELWEKWEYENNGIRNAKFKKIFIPIRIVPFSLRTSSREEFVEALEQSRKSLDQVCARELSLQDERKKLNEELEHIKRKFQELEAEKRELVTENTNRTNELKSLRIQLEKLENSYHRTCLNYNSSLDHIHSLQKRVEELDSQNKTLQEQVQEQSNLSELWSERCKAEEEYKNDFMRRLQVKEEQVSELEVEVINLKEQIKSKERLLVAAQKNLRSLRETLSNVDISETSKRSDHEYNTSVPDIPGNIDI
ncbi:hypothetical protein GpartN1_g7578.t1 [Galdieria partita]|uniref:Uncharacterized protein n=1 Tax=Galdieria partita TaxID=83374 RepID=A0A9C7UUV4_9RHOD|nr:hypothetical protein GpartN1_g7578.t1 [Galdieria partita]